MKPADNAFAREAIEAKGWWGAHRWLVLRRLVQLSVLALFLVGPWFGWWIVKGNLNYSLTLGTLPLADIERIEVLTDGAASLYGTDAIAGAASGKGYDAARGAQVIAWAKAFLDDALPLATGRWADLAGHVLQRVFRVADLAVAVDLVGLVLEQEAVGQTRCVRDQIEHVGALV